ncbi:MAG: hypothetical protein PHE24_01115 [Patescibacteria group bacterium]|nr:hypothetical protein [Patescibacteria group bacterium]
MATKIPRLKQRPDWWHSHGDEMRITNFIRENGYLAIGGRAEQLTISKNFTENYYDVAWRVVHGPSEIVTGCRIMKKESLQNAFGLIEATIDNQSQWLINHYGGDAAEQAKFIRDHNYLCIPCPGTGRDGDPNISIKLNKKIKQAVAKLLA